MDKRPLRTTRRLANFAEGRPGWYRITNKSNGPTVVHIYDEIGFMGTSADNFVSDLAQIKGDLEMHLNSPGGDVFDGLAIYNALKSRQGTVHIVVDGLAASCASWIAQAATPGKLEMAPHSQMMIHDGFGMAIGNAADMRKTADLLDKASDNIAGIYADRTGQPAEYWRNAMQAETWYSDQEAVDAGLADRIVGQEPVSNAWDLSVFANWPGDLSNVSKPHGDVPYADPGYLDADGEQVSKSGKEGVARYPIDEEHVQAAWSYINQEDNAGQYTPEQLSSIKSKIKSAMKKYGHDVADDNQSNELDLARFSQALQEVFR